MLLPCVQNFAPSIVLSCAELLALGSSELNPNLQNVYIAMVNNADNEEAVTGKSNGNRLCPYSNIILDLKVEMHKRKLKAQKLKHCFFHFGC